MSKKQEEEVNIDRSVTNYERQFYGRNTEIIYCGTRVGRWGEDVRDETCRVIR
jgi:hypothetical protein